MFEFGLEARPAGPTLSGMALGFLKAFLPHFYFWFFGAQQARKGKKRKGRERKRTLS
jgi:hypothetical protein